VKRLGFGFAMVCWAAACGTDAVGIAECRQVEQARCNAAVSCGFPDYTECRLYYRDHCLHGLAIETINSVQVDACVAVIERAGRCASEQPDTAPGDCAEPIRTDTEVATACEVVLQPELASACAFLEPDPVPVPPPASPAADGGT
jgi:hypothetical protein